MDTVHRGFRPLHRSAVVVSVLIAGAALLGMPGKAAAQLTTGFGGGFGSTIGPDGALYVAQGAVGRVSRVDPTTGETTTFASGLPTAIIGFGGPVDVAFIGATPYVLVSTVGDPLLGGLVTDGIYRVDGPTDFTIIADLGTWSADNLPDTGDGDDEWEFVLVNGVQYALEAYRGGFLVTDGHHNRVLQVTHDGEVTEFRAFGNIVPTGLEVQGDTVYMGESGPIKHDPEDGKVVSIDAKSRAKADVASGASMIVDVERGRGQTLYALSQGIWDGEAEGSPAIEYTGSLVRVNDDGTFTPLVHSLNIPTSLQFIGNTAYIVTLREEIWAIPNVSAPPFGEARGR